MGKGLTSGITTTISVISLLFLLQISFGCESDFEGFGIFLGAVRSLNATDKQTIEDVIDKLYYDLELRYYRTSYEPKLSPIEGVYLFPCDDSPTCTWNTVHRIISRYENISIFASIWSPPHYMKKNFFLRQEYEMRFYYYIKNITALIQKEFNITIERVSPVNEPENIFAPWDHCNIDPRQLCRMVADYNDPFTALGPENAYFWITKLYLAYKGPGPVNCMKAFDVLLTHGYALNTNTSSSNYFEVYYDPTKYPRLKSKKPIWMTEVSSTYGNAEHHQMKEALDLGTHIINFVGTTCVTRYYFWLAYTNWPSGESLIWGNWNGTELSFPKKYFAFKHFTLSAAGGSKSVKKCSLKGLYSCLSFGAGAGAAAFVNSRGVLSQISHFTCKTLCCTTEEKDFHCVNGGSTLPPKSVCSCVISSIIGSQKDFQRDSNHRFNYGNGNGNNGSSKERGTHHRPAVNSVDVEKIVRHRHRQDRNLTKGLIGNNGPVQRLGLGIWKLILGA